MYICTACGSNIPEGRRFCPACGAMLEPGAQSAETGYTGDFTSGYAYRPYQSVQSAPPARDPSPAPTYAYQNPEKSRERVMGTGEFFLSLLLMFLPAIGLIIQIIWACGGARNKNRVHLARGYLIFTILMYVLILIGFYYAYTYLYPVIEPYLNMMAGA